MQTLSSARRTCIALRSASEWTATVLMPISLQARSTRRAISPRFAIRIFSNICLLDDDERFAELHRLGVLHQHGCDLARTRSGDGVECLHRLDEEEGCALGDRIA